MKKSGITQKEMKVLSAGNPPILELTDDWEVAVIVSCGDGSQVRKTVKVPPPTVVQVCDEQYPQLPDFDPDAWGGWKKGTALNGIRAHECTTCFALIPESLKVASSKGKNAVIYEKGNDYDADLDWASLGRLSTGRIKPEQPVFLSYKYVEQRLDSIILDTSGRIVLRKGISHIATPSPPKLDDGEIRLANIFIERSTERLDASNLYPVLETSFPQKPEPSPSIAERLLPKSMEKLRHRGKLNVLAWGDSVTDGSYLANPGTERWQEQFVTRLRKRFPNAQIELVTEAWGGRNTTLYLAEPPGSVHNYKEKVLDIKPDLIVMEFVNDAGLDGKELEKQYGKLQRDIKEIGAEWVIVAPHYIRPDWMGLTAQREIDDDPRPYVKSLREFTSKWQIPLADASLRYGRLWRQGIPYNTLMTNNINHPDPRGMKIFADSLMALFP